MIFIKKFIYILLILTLLKSYTINNVFTNEVDEAKQGKIVVEKTVANVTLYIITGKMQGIDQ